MKTKRRKTKQVGESTTCVTNDGRNEAEADNLGTKTIPCSTIRLVSQGGKRYWATRNKNHTTHQSKKYNQREKIPRREEVGGEGEAQVEVAPHVHE